MIILAQQVWEHQSWADKTVVHPAGLTVLLLTLAVGLLSSRRQIAVGVVILTACFIPPAQRIVVAGLDFPFLRIVVLGLALRILIRGEYLRFRWLALDTVVTAFLLTTILATGVLYGGDVGMLVNRVGMGIDSLGFYFIFRCLVRSPEDLAEQFRFLALISIPVVMVFTVERFTGRNLFAVLGGVPEMTVVRNGRLRCQGAFAHPILAGSFFASAAAVFIGMWLGGGKRVAFGLLGLITCVLLIGMVASSTPISGLMIAVIGWVMFPLRKSLRLVQIAVVLLAVALHFAMNKGVFHLLARVDLVGGSTGYHRYMLIDRAAHFFSEWAPFGTSSTAHWGWGMHDVTNQYILDGTRGGVLASILRIAMYVIGFAYIGRALRASRLSRPDVFLAYGLGVCLLVHAVIFISVSYFGQIVSFWSLCLAATTVFRPGVRTAEIGRPEIRRSGPRLDVGLAR